MFCLTRTKNHLAAALLLFAVAPAEAAIVTTFYENGTELPVQIGSATINFELTPAISGYYKFGAVATEGGFGRYVQTNGSCIYWFRAADVANIASMTTDYSIYDTVYPYAGDTEATAALVDGATWSDDNYVSYFDAENTLVAVLRFGLTEGEEKMRLLSMSYDSEGLNFGEGILQTSGIPEPSGAALLTLSAAGILFARRRQR